VVGILPADLLRRHIPDGAHDGAGLGADGDRLVGLRLANAGESEIEDLGAAVAGDEDVVGFEIAMDDAGGVRDSLASNFRISPLRHRRVGPSDAGVSSVTDSRCTRPGGSAKAQPAA
jgi:hypothetical protein